MGNVPLESSVARGHEPAATDLRVVWLSGLGLVALMIATLLIVAGLMWLLAAESEKVPAIAIGRAASDLPAGVPALDVNQSAQLERLFERQRAMLTQSQWVDRPAGVARIPIDQAISIIAERGLPTSFGGKPAEEGPSHD